MDHGLLKKVAGGKTFSKYSLSVDLLVIQR